MVSRVKAHQEAVADYRRRYEDARVGLLREQQEMGNQVWSHLQQAQQPAAGPEAADGRAPFQAASAALERAQRQAHFGTEVTDKLLKAQGAFYQCLAEAKEEIDRRIATGERDYFRSLQQAIASIDPDMLDPATLSMLTAAVLSASSTAHLVIASPATAGGETGPAGSGSPPAT
jgi:hypothetical protein